MIYLRVGENLRELSRLLQHADLCQDSSNSSEAVICLSKNIFCTTAIQSTFRWACSSNHNPDEADPHSRSDLLGHQFAVHQILFLE